MFEGATIDDATNQGQVFVRLKSLTLTYDSYIITNPSQLAAVQASKVTYICDFPLFASLSLDHGRREQSLYFEIPPKTIFFYIIFLHESQLIPGSHKHSLPHSNFKFPKHLDEIHLQFAGHHSLLQRGGLRGLSLPSGYNSESLRRYHSWLHSSGLYQKNFSSYKTRGPVEQNTSFDQALLVDIQPWKSDQTERLNCRLVYKESSLEKMSMRLVLIQQRAFTYSRAEGWSWTIV
jgi:hypothetical protein